MPERLTPEEMLRRLKMAGEAGAPSGVPRPVRRADLLGASDAARHQPQAEDGVDDPWVFEAVLAKGRPQVLPEDPQVAAQVLEWVRGERQRAEDLQRRHQAGVQAMATAVDQAAAAPVPLVTVRCPRHGCRNALGWVYETRKGLLWRANLLAVPADDKPPPPPWIVEGWLRQLSMDVLTDDEALLGKLMQFNQVGVLAWREGGDRARALVLEVLAPSVTTDPPTPLWVRCHEHPDPPDDTGEHVDVARAYGPAYAVLAPDRERLVDTAVAAVQSGKKVDYNWRGHSATSPPPT